MIYLLLSILSSTCIFVLFQQFGRRNVQNIFAIMANYVVACLLGIWLMPNKIKVDFSIIEKEWFWPAVFIGFLFVAMFQVMAVGAQKLGVSRASVLVKMSVVIPVLAGFFLHQEKVSFWAGIGILAALAAVYLSTYRKEKSSREPSAWILAIVLFVGPGIIDSTMKVAQQNWLQPSEMAFFSAILFGFAFFWGLIFSGFQFVKKHKKPTAKDLLWGVLLGIPNFGSIYFILLALEKSGWQSAVIYPINNVAIITATTLIGFWAFRENVSKVNFVGILLGVISIFLIAYG